MSETVTLPFAFLAGLASFLSPCVLPLIPSYFSYMTGLSIEELSHPKTKEGNLRRLGTHALLFVLGFSAVFVVLGATASALGQLFAQHKVLIQRIGGGLVIFFGIYLTGILKIGFLSREKRFSFPDHPAGFFGSFLLGAIFAFGWVPCVGPILGSILLLAGTSENFAQGIFYLAVYSLGLGVPFVASALAINFFFATFQKLKRYLRAIEVGSGLVLIGVGILLVTNGIFWLTNFLNSVLAPLVRLFSL